MKNENGELKKNRAKNFDSLLRCEFQDLSDTFWTPEEVIQTAIDWLELDASSKVLDIGSGVGKFCIEGAGLSNAQFTGVEIRQNLTDEAERIANKLQLKNCTFICKDIKEVGFSEFNAFYYYNPFCEHLAIDEVIDDSLELSRENHRKYEDLVLEKLEKLNSGASIITYRSSEFALPSSYRLIKMNEEGSLILWRKED